MSLCPRPALRVFDMDQKAKVSFVKLDFFSFNSYILSLKDLVIKINIAGECLILREPVSFNGSNSSNLGLSYLNPIYTFNFQSLTFMGSHRIDFFTHQQKLLYTATLPDFDILVEMLHEILVYDVNSEHAYYSMRVWNISSGEDVLIHHYKFPDIPEGTQEVFEKYNALFPVAAATSVNPDSNEEVH